jgi:hypothetical protein
VRVRGTAGIRNDGRAVTQVRRLARCLPGPLDDVKRLVCECLIAIFHDQLPASMVVLVKLLNDGALWLSSAYDRVRPSPVPYIFLPQSRSYRMLTHPLLRCLTVWKLGSSSLSPV